MFKIPLASRMENQLSIERFLRHVDVSTNILSTPHHSVLHVPAIFFELRSHGDNSGFAVFISRTVDRATRQRATEGTRGKKSGALRRLTPALLCKPYYFARPPQFVGNCSRGCEEKCGTRPRKSTQRGVACRVALPVSDASRTTTAPRSPSLILRRMNPRTSR